MPFGKYKGMIVKEVIKKDYNYIFWVLKNKIMLFDRSCFGNTEKDNMSSHGQDQAFDDFGGFNLDYDLGELF